MNKIKNKKSMNQIYLTLKLLTPNIYLLTYDAYVNNDVMDIYDIDNSNQEKFLKEQGFKIYPNAYTVSTQSVYSMGRMLNLKKYGEHKAVAGDSTSTKILKNNGYKIIGLFKNRYFFNSQNNLDYYDESFPKVRSRGMINAIFKGDFLWDVDKIKNIEKQFLKVKSKWLTKKIFNPIFIYSHTGPYHSVKNGTCNAEKEVSLFKQRLVKSNKEMETDVKNIKKYNPNSIIIINGDHGPFLLNKCGRYKNKKKIELVSKSFLKDNFGSFLAIHWPKKYKDEFPKTNIVILQDVFFEIFEYILKSNNLNKFRIDPITDEKEGGE